MTIELFTQTHEPVDSKTLQTIIDSSNATIRNDITKPEELDLFEKARISGGRMPNAADFKCFVEHSLGPDSIDKHGIYQVIKAFDFKASKLGSILQKTSQVLTDMTGYTSMTLGVEPARQKLTAFGIAQLSSRNALTVLTLDESKPATIQSATPKNFMLKDLVTLKEIVNERLLERTVIGTHHKLRTEIPQILQKYFTMTDNMLDLLGYILTELSKELVFAAGKVNSLDYANLETYRFLDNDQRVTAALRSSTREDEIVTVQVADSQEVALANVAVLTHKFLISYRRFGLLNLIGPIDMDYRRSVSLVNAIGYVLMMRLSDCYRYPNNNHYEVN